MKNKNPKKAPGDNKKEILRSLEDRMSNTYEKIKEEGQYEYEKNLLKTYVIESNFKNPLDVVKQPLSDNSQNNDDSNIEIKKIEKNFFDLSIKKKGYEATFYLDSMNPRFWVLHTTDNVKNADYLLRFIVQPMYSHLDNLWLDKGMLNEISHSHSNLVKSIGIQYRHGDVFPTDDFGETFTMRAHGAPSDKILTLLRNNEELSNYFAISSVGFKKETDTTDDSQTSRDVIIEDINYHGKFTVRGTSFHNHIETVDSIRDMYESRLSLIETEFNLCYKQKNDKIQIHGGPLCIDFKKEIKDLDQFVKIIFSSKDPFRLSGYSKKMDSSTMIVAGVDLHNGDDFNLEITPNWIRMYLSEGGCGNTLMRFVCNLQRYYDANATLSGVEYGKII